MKTDNEPIIKKWVAELRSGEYKQGTGFLRQDGEDQDKLHCCLGVLCELYEKEGNEGFTEENNILGLYQVLPLKVRDWAGLTDNMGVFSERIKGARSLSRLNDNGCSFTEIADIIESKPEGLFV